MSSKFVAALCAAITLSTVSTVNAQAQRGDRYIDTTPSLGASNTQSQSVSSDGSLAGPPATCVRVVTNPLINGTSGNGRAPTTNWQFIRTHYLITAAELATAGYTNGAIPTVIGWVYSTANNGGTAPLTIYMENTADTTNTKSATWATAIATMQVVHSAPTTLPNTVGAVDITMTGGTPFTYTGGGIYIAFDWGQFTPNGAGAVISCNTNGLTNGLFGAQSNTAAPTTLAVSSFRPITRLNGVSLLNDAAIVNVQAMGLLAPCRVPVQIIRAVVTNNGQDTLTNLPVTLTIAGVDAFTDTQNVASLTGCGGTGVVTFLAYTPTALGNNTVSISVPNDTNNANNLLTRNMDNTTDEISHKHPGSTASGGVGFTGGVGAFVAKITTTAADTITHVTLEFPGTTPPATVYRVAIYGDNAGAPASGVPLYLDAADRTVGANGPVAIELDSPLAVPAGNYYVGIHQINTVNAGVGFDTETSIRPGTYFFAAALPVVTWTDFAPANTFKLNIGIVLQTGCTEVLGACCTKSGCIPSLTETECVLSSEGTWFEGASCETACAPPCPADTNNDGQVNVTDLLAVISAWGTCTGCSADINNDGNVNVTDLLAVISAWGTCD